MEQRKLNPTSRFSDRVENYVKFRPSYPAEVLSFLTENVGLKPHHKVVDIGSGTGIFSELLLQSGCHVIGVEPNGDMRKAAEQILIKYPRFTSIDGRSEETGLDDGSADFVTAAQAFHWFERGPTRKEFKRILKPAGYVILIWNDRRTDASAFAADYEDLINRYGTDYKKVNHKNIIEKDIRDFLGAQGFGKKIFENHQDLDFASLAGRLTSSSYAPNTGHPQYEDMIRSLKDIFEKYEVSGKVRIQYDTRMFYGQLTP